MGAEPSGFDACSTEKRWKHGGFVRRTALTLYRSQGKCHADEDLRIYLAFRELQIIRAKRKNGPRFLFCFTFAFLFSPGSEITSFANSL